MSLCRLYGTLLEKILDTQEYRALRHILVAYDVLMLPLSGIIDGVCHLFRVTLEYHTARRIREQLCLYGFPLHVDTVVTPYYHLSPAQLAFIDLSVPYIFPKPLFI